MAWGDPGPCPCSLLIYQILGDIEALRGQDWIYLR